MKNSQQRHDISDKVGGLLSPLLPGQAGQWGGVADDNRKFLNGVFWVLRTGALWRDMPPVYGNWSSIYERFRRWRIKRVWEKILEALIDEPEMEWLMRMHPIARCILRQRERSVAIKTWNAQKVA